MAYAYYEGGRGGMPVEESAPEEETVRRILRVLYECAAAAQGAALASVTVTRAQEVDKPHGSVL